MIFFVKKDGSKFLHKGRLATGLINEGRVYFLFSNGETISTEVSLRVINFGIACGYYKTIHKNEVDNAPYIINERNVPNKIFI